MLAGTVLRGQGRLRPDPGRPERVGTINESGDAVSLNLVPFRAPLSKPTAAAFFTGVRSLEQLFSAYREAARRATSLPERRHLTLRAAELAAGVE